MFSALSVCEAADLQKKSTFVRSKRSSDDVDAGYVLREVVTAFLLLFIYFIVLPLLLLLLFDVKVI